MNVNINSSYSKQRTINMKIGSGAEIKSTKMSIAPRANSIVSSVKKIVSLKDTKDTDNKNKDRNNNGIKKEQKRELSILRNLPKVPKK